ncbi:MAG: bifunctional DedA family/phosphatase PAP2 family protein [Gammaproteobacteria bacterium]
MSEIISPLLQWLNDHPQLSGLFTFIISAIESIAILGTIIPGTIMMTAIGALAGAGVIPLWPTIFWAILGAIVGDGISYWIGYAFKHKLVYAWPFRTRPNLLKSGERFFHKYGSMSVFIGRFVGPVRALVPLVAGMLGMTPLRFYVANILSAIGWAPAYMLPGILLGAASLELPPDIAIHVILVFVLITLFVLLCLWFLYKLIKLVSNQIDQLQNTMWKKLKTSRWFAPTTTLLKHHDPQRTHGQLSLAMVFLFTSLLFVGLALYVKWKGASNIAVNDAIFHLFRSIRSNSLDNIMLTITILGQRQIIALVVAAICLWLVLKKHVRTALHVLGLGVLAGSSVFILKHLIQSMRPWGIAKSPETFSMPSGHTVLSATIYMGIAFLIARFFSRQYRWPIYLIAALIALMVGISRLYLGAHWFTDVLSSWLLSTSLLTLVIIAYQRREEKVVHPAGVIMVTVLVLALGITFFQYRLIPTMEKNYAQIDTPIIKVSESAWWDKNDILPAYRASLFGFPSSQINIAWAGSFEDIKTTLLQEGWEKPPARDWISTLHRIADISSAQYLPLISPQYLDKRPILILMRMTDTKNGKRLLVLRLWNSNRTIIETKQPLWVGILGVAPRSYSWLFKKNSGAIDASPALVFPNEQATKSWKWHSIMMNLPTGTDNIIQQKILLIKENQPHRK